jgi:hypothetical protein
MFHNLMYPESDSAPRGAGMVRFKGGEVACNDWPFAEESLDVRGPLVDCEAFDESVVLAVVVEVVEGELVDVALLWSNLVLVRWLGCADGPWPFCSALVVQRIRLPLDVTVVHEHICREHIHPFVSSLKLVEVSLIMP